MTDMVGFPEDFMRRRELMKTQTAQVVLAVLSAVHLLVAVGGVTPEAGAQGISAVQSLNQKLMRDPRPQLGFGNWDILDDPQQPKGALRLENALKPGEFVDVAKGRSGIEVSALGLGRWAIGGQWYGQVHDDESIRAIQCAMGTLSGKSAADTTFAEGDIHGAAFE